MMFQDAQAALAQFLSPLSVDEFLDQALHGGFRKIAFDERAPRTELLGPDPAAVLGRAFHLAPALMFHSANPLGPAPSLAGVTDAADFRARIEQFHARNYSVRFPDLRPLSPDLDRLARAMEILLHQPVSTSAFWSRGGMRAPVHYDDHDLLVVQLRGTKRWYISTKPTVLPNPWRSLSEEIPDLGPHETVDVSPGDVLYLPRGTYHSVDSSTESLHLAIGFTPLTMRDALMAALDHLSDLDQGLRTSVGGRLAYQLKGSQFEQLAAPVTEAAGTLLAACRTPGFLAAAMHRRSARAVARLRPLPMTEGDAPLTLDTVLIQGDAAFCHLTGDPEKIDFSYPGGHFYIHRGAQESVLFMLNNVRFRVRDIPGPIGDDVRLSLAGKFVEVGFLQVADGAAKPQAAYLTV